MWSAPLPSPARASCARAVGEPGAGALQGTDGSVLLAHGGPALTPLILSAVIALHHDPGVRFVAVPELLGWTAP